MATRWLVLDVNNLGWRSFHTRGKLSHGGAVTGVVFGLLKDISKLMDDHATTDVAFCFDLGRGKRKDLFPGYKDRRHRKSTPEQEAQRAEVRRQLDALRTEHLPGLGYRNVFAQDGYEADDLIASFVKNMKADDTALIVSTDHDLYQLINRRVSVWDPREGGRPVDYPRFRREYHLAPAKWVHVKALAGCDTDEVPGCPGVKEKTAVAFFTGQIPDHHKIKGEIEAFMSGKAYQRNLRLVTLPYPGTKDVRAFKDKLDRAAWVRLTDKLGMKSIRDAIPGRRPKPVGFGFH